MSSSPILLSRAIAQAVVDRLRGDIPYGLNVIGADGRILGSVDPDRVGDLHESALEVLRTGQPVEVHTARGGERPGLNLAIELDGRRIGVVGVTGPPAQVRAIARLVASTVTLLIEQGDRVRRDADRHSQRQRLAERLLRGTPVDDLVEEARDLGVDLHGEHVVVLLPGGLPPGLRWPPGGLDLSPSAPAVLLRASQPLPDGLPSGAVTGPASPSVAASLRGAREAARVADALGLREQVLPHARVAGLTPLTRVPPGEHPLDALAGHDDLLDTLRTVIRRSLDLQASARDLHVHRNTLSYRLDRIRTLTGLDPRNTLDLIRLIEGLVRATPWSDAQPVSGDLP